MTTQMYDEALAKLRSFLADELPVLSDRWWEDLALPHLSRSTQTIAQSLGPHALTHLDLADILRVAEHNWWRIAKRHGLPPRVFSLIKTLQLSRNAYAHRSSASLSLVWEHYDRMTLDLLFKYLDTIQFEQAA